MMPERKPPDDPVEWLNRAKSNLERARADVRWAEKRIENEKGADQ